MDVNAIDTPQIRGLRNQIAELQGFKDDMHAFTVAVDYRLTILKGGPTVTTPPTTTTPSSTTSDTPTSSTTSGAAVAATAATASAGESSTNPLAAASAAETTKIDGMIASFM